MTYIKRDRRRSRHVFSKRKLLKMLMAFLKHSKKIDKKIC
tara:strand:+ start:51 stop:170 length:120 start_codon:yes stop_codon:yes gene_type:complete